jgi:SAM-dependent methyltransferase
MTAPSHADRARSFDAAAAQYAANRPSYPPALFDAIEELAARPLTGARVVDIGAGTGIATTLLHRRGADVLAVEPGDGMAAQFRLSHPDIPIVRGNGNALPLATASADFITYAQAWHWTDPAHSVPEVLRVLRPSGALALWWNTTPLDIPWHVAQARRIEGRFGNHPVVEQNGSGARAALTDPTGHLDFTRRKVRWSRRVPIDTHLANLGSHSIFLVHGTEASTAFFTEEKQLLLDTFPDGLIEETYDVDLLVANTS